MKYLDKTFAVTVGGDAYADGWERIFGKKTTTPTDNFNPDAPMVPLEQEHIFTEDELTFRCSIGDGWACSPSAPCAGCKCNGKRCYCPLSGVAL
jgi:hypothetical protein